MLQWAQKWLTNLVSEKLTEKKYAYLVVFIITYAIYRFSAGGSRRVEEEAGEGGEEEFEIRNFTKAQLRQFDGKEDEKVRFCAMYQLFLPSTNKTNTRPTQLSPFLLA